MKEANKTEKAKTVITTLAFLAVLLTLTSPVLHAATTPNVFVYPDTYSPSATGEIFTIKVNVTDAVSVSGYGINMRFDPTLLVVTGWQSGGFLETSGVSTIGLAPGNHSDIGWVALGDTLSGPGSASGAGTLVKINFTTRGGGRCALHLYNTSLLNEATEQISHTETDGQFVYNYVSLTPSNGTGTFMIQGFGFGQNAHITSATWNGTMLPLMDTVCDGHGNFVTPGILPDISTPGNYTISVLDSSGNRKDAIFTLTAATGITGPQGAQGIQGLTGPQGPAGTGGADSYTWAALGLSIVAIIIGIYAVAKKKS